MGDAERDAQIRQMMIAQEHHGSLIGTVRAFADVRRIQANLLKIAERFGIDFKGKRVLILGPGEGDEAATIMAATGHIPEDVMLTAVEVSGKKATLFREIFPSAKIIIVDFNKAELPPEQTIIQMGYCFHDQTKAEKQDLLKRCFTSLEKGGILCIAEAFLTQFPNIDVTSQSPENAAVVDQDLNALYDGVVEDLMSLMLEEGKDVDSALDSVVVQGVEQSRKDALSHQDGREAFETPASITEKLAAAGFTRIRFKRGRKMSGVVIAVKP